MEKRIQELKTRIEDHDEILDKNKNSLSEQINKVLKGDYENTKKEVELKIEEFKVRSINSHSGFKVLKPTFQYETYVEHQQVLRDVNQFKLSRLEDGLVELEKKREKVVADIKEQNARIEKERPDMIAELKELGEDVSGYEKPKTEYIG